MLQCRIKTGLGHGTIPLSEKHDDNHHETKTYIIQFLEFHSVKSLLCHIKIGDVFQGKKKKLKFAVVTSAGDFPLFSSYSPLSKEALKTSDS